MDIKEKDIAIMSTKHINMGEQEHHLSVGESQNVLTLRANEYIIANKHSKTAIISSKQINQILSNVIVTDHGTLILTENKFSKNTCHGNIDKIRCLDVITPNKCVMITYDTIIKLINFVTENNIITKFDYAGNMYDICGEKNPNNLFRYFLVKQISQNKNRIHAHMIILCGVNNKLTNDYIATIKIICENFHESIGLNDIINLIKIIHDSYQIQQKRQKTIIDEFSSQNIQIKHHYHKKQKYTTKKYEEKMKCLIDNYKQVRDLFLRMEDAKNKHIKVLENEIQKYKKEKRQHIETYNAKSYKIIEYPYH